MKLLIAVLLLCLSIEVLAQRNIALNKPVTASAYRASTALLPELVTDGKTNTRWASEYQDNQWIMVDLLGPVTITDIRIHWHTDYAVSYRVEVSLDGIEWQIAHDQPNGKGKIEDIPIASTGRYVRLVLHKRLRTYGFSLWELMVFGEQSPFNTSSSMMTIASSQSSSSVSPITNINATLSWKIPTQRENGEVLSIQEMGGYEILSIVGQNKPRTEVIIENPKTTSYTLTTQSNVLFKIAAFDKNGLYSKFIDIKPVIAKAPPSVKNLRLRTE